MPTLVSVFRLSELCNPFTGDPWQKGTASVPGVSEALLDERLCGTPGGDDHDGRIAYLVVHAAKDPIEIDVGVPELGCHPAWLVEDGNHRLAAAIYKGQDEIHANVSGSVGYAKELLDADIL